MWVECVGVCGALWFGATFQFTSQGGCLGSVGGPGVAMDSNLPVRVQPGTKIKLVE